MYYFLEITGKPFVKQRPQVNNATGNVFTPQKTLNYETRVSNLFQIKYPNHKLLTGAISVCFFLFMPIPKSASKKKREEMLSFSELPTTKKDLSNMIKVLEDGLNLVAYHDDGQICDIYTIKRYSDRPRAIIILKEKQINA
jgi:Holliday junction resolvase RusA-like endonuclease